MAWRVIVAATIRLTRRTGCPDWPGTSYSSLLIRIFTQEDLRTSEMLSCVCLPCISTATPQCYLFPFFNSLVLEIKFLFGNPFQKFWKKPVDPFGESTGTLVLVGLFGFRRSLNRRVYAPSNSPPYIPLVSRVTRTNRRRHNANSIWVLVFWFLM